MSLPVITAFLSLGSNLGDRIDNLKSGLGRLSTPRCSASRKSSIFETEPVDYLDQPLFLNCVVEVATPLTPLDLLRRVQEIEAACGRVRTVPKGPRTLDIDILLYGDLVMNTSELTIPHPALLQRRFVLEPLAELAPEMIIPGTSHTVTAALALLPATPAVRRIAQKL
jgi:2-amino-4-hydroxy-6-hydroxymethyldihydropteridine diphosphokinase